MIDPLAVGRAEMTPYHYVSNNPISRVDPDGRWDWYQSNATGTVKWFEGSGEQDGFRHIGAQGTVTSYGGNAGVVNLNSDGSATNAASGEQATYSTSGKTRIVEKDNTSEGYKMFLDIFSAGAYSRESRALDILDRDGPKAYNYQKISDAHTEIFQGWMSGEYQLGASASRAAKLSVDDVLNNPSLLQGKPLSQVQNALGKTEGWVNDVMRRSTRAEGWVLREMNPARTDPTGRMIQYHLGTPRHFGGQPYWKVSTGPGGTVRIPQQP